MLGTTEIKTKIKALSSKIVDQVEERKMNKEVQKWLLHLQLWYEKDKEIGEKNKNRGRLQRKGNT